MVLLDTKVKLPFLWGKAVFKKSHWPQINLIVGPNGSGKTLLAQSLSEQFEQAGFSVRFISEARQNQQEQLYLLKTNKTIRTKIEKVLSDMFGKTIIFIEDINHELIPIVKNRAWNVEYMLEDAECHGLRDIISLLVSLHTKKRHPGSLGECLFFDEPELHLHPQFQSFFMNEIRKEVRHSSRRIFFLISHSPFFIDLRTSEDLTGVIACHTNTVPSTIETLSAEDENLFRRFLPRFNSYHKQFFFSDNQIFVEGYTDQQMFTHLLPFISNQSDAAGTGIIDVGGKDELGVFCKVCALLGTNSRIITDLDSLFSGKLRDVFCDDIRVKQWLEKQRDKQDSFYRTFFTPKEMHGDITMAKLIYVFERMLIAVGKELTDSPPAAASPRLKLLITKLCFLLEKHNNAENVDTYKTVLLQGINTIQDEIAAFITPKTAATLPVIKNLAAYILAGAEAARVYILPRGCIEHYYTRSDIQYMPVSAKDKLFRMELEYIQTAARRSVRASFRELITILEKACSKA